MASQDLKTIFRTPTKRNYDEFEILERSNFDSDDSNPSKNLVDRPRSYANAQILLRFGGEKEGCACGNGCTCRGGGCPCFTPLCFIIPPCYPYYSPQIPQAPGLVPPPPSQKPEEGELNENVVDELPKESEINNHPVILKEVKLTDEVIKPAEDIEKCLKDVSAKIDPKEVSPNVKFVALDLTKAPTGHKNGIRDLEQSLIPYLGTGQVRPKLLVKYPIFNRENEIVLPPKTPIEFQSGYRFSEGSYYYSDPVKSLVYKKPPVLMDLGPQKIVKYYLVPVNEPVIVPVNDPRLRPHDDDCCCCSCAKYAGELNEKML